MVCEKCGLFVCLGGEVLLVFFEFSQILLDLFYYSWRIYIIIENRDRVACGTIGATGAVGPLAKVPVFLAGPVFVNAKISPSKRAGSVRPHRHTPG